MAKPYPGMIFDILQKFLIGQKLSVPSGIATADPYLLCDNGELFARPVYLTGHKTFYIFCGHSCRRCRDFPVKPKKKTRQIFITMSEKASVERIKQNAQIAKDTIGTLKNELNNINQEYNNILAKQLREENARLLAAVEEAKKKLVHLELQNGVEQIPIPGQNQTVLTAPIKEPEANPSETQLAKSEAKPKKEKKPKELKHQKEAQAELAVDIGRLDLRIGKVEDVQRHPDADSLYVLKINCGEDKPRTVCSGLVKYIPIDELKDRIVLLLCNLKPVKMRGITSEAMVMCASSEQGVEVLIPPPNCQPGDLVHCEGYTRQPEAVMNPKKKVFETVAPDLHTNGKLEACYKNTPLNVPGKGNFVSKSLKNVPVK